MPNSKYPAGLFLKYEISNSELVKAAELFDQAFSAKFKHAIPDDSTRIKFWSEILNEKQIVGAHIDGELVGMALITFEGRPGILKTAKKSLFKILGVLQGLRTAFYFFLFSKLDKKIVLPNAYLEAISVSEQCRGLGIGNKLISETARISKERGAKFLLLQVVLENHQARKLYERIGFKTLSTTKTPFLKIFTQVGGATLMAKEL